MTYSINNPRFKDRRRELRKKQTDAEQAFWNLIRNRQLNGLKFFRQYSNGPYILDFYCPEIKLVVEIDGGQHSEIGQFQHDLERTQFLEQQKIHVVRFWNNEVLTNPEGVWQRLDEKIDQIQSNSS